MIKQSKIHKRGQDSPIGGARTVLAEYQTHYNTARPHQGIAQRVPDSECRAPLITATDSGVERVRRKTVLNGLINEYVHAA